MSICSPLTSAVQGFLRYLRVERQLSPLTQSNYQRQLTACVLLLDEMKLSAWDKLDAAQVRSLAARSRRAGLKSASLALRLSALRSFLDWQISQGALKANPARSVATPRAPRHLPKNIDVDEVNRLLEIDINDPLAVRDRAMLEIMYGAGLRLSELVGIDTGHLDLASGEVWVVGKGSKERRLPIGRTAVQWVEHWLEMRALFAPKDNAVFLSKQGKRISQRNVQKRFAEWGVKQGFPAIFIPISCATPLPLICWNPAAIYAPFRSCWAMPASAPRKSIPILISNIWHRFTMLLIPVRNEENPDALLPPAAAHCRNDV